MILETLTYLFTSDMEALEKGEKNAEKQAEKLDKKLKEVDNTADGVGKGFTDLIATAGGALTALLSFGALANGIAQTSAYVDNLAKTSRLLGENIDQLGAYQELVVKSGGDVASFQGSIKRLNEQFNEFVATGNTGALPFMQKLGISMVDSQGNARKVLDVLPELADAFQGLSKSESAGLGQKLGLDEGTVALLQQGRRVVEEQVRKQKELFSITEKQAKIFEDFNDSVSDTSTSFRGLFVELGADVLPILQYLLERVQSFVGWLKENSRFVTGTFIALGVALTAYALPSMIKFGIATVTAFAPFYLIGAVIAGVAIGVGLLYDDIMTFLEGGNSAFERMLRWFGATDETIAKVKQGFRDLGAFLSDTVDFIGELMKTMVGYLLDPIKFWKDLLDTIGQVTGMGGAIDKVKGWFGFGKDDSQPAMAMANNTIQSANSNPMNNITSSMISNTSPRTNNSNVKIDKIEVQTQATDADGISQSINSTLSNQLKNTTATYEDGIEA